MADIKVTEMNEALELKDNDLFMVIQDGENKKIAASKVKSAEKNINDLEEIVEAKDEDVIQIYQDGVKKRIQLTNLLPDLAGTAGGGNAAGAGVDFSKYPEIEFLEPTDFVLVQQVSSGDIRKAAVDAVHTAEQNVVVSRRGKKFKLMVDETGNLTAEELKMPLNEGYEVKLFMNPGRILDSNGIIKNNVMTNLGFTFGAKKPLTIMNMTFMDDTLKTLDKLGWNLRIRQKNNSSKLEVTYKKRWAVKGRQPDFLQLAADQGFCYGNEDSKGIAFEAEIDWGYGKKTLSLGYKAEPKFSSDEMKTAFTNAGADITPFEDETYYEIPPIKVCKELFINNAPDLFVDDLIYNGIIENKEGLADYINSDALGFYGPTGIVRYQGTIPGTRADDLDEMVEFRMEVCYMKDEAGTGYEYIVEASQGVDPLGEGTEEQDKITDHGGQTVYQHANIIRNRMEDLLEQAGCMMYIDQLKTQILLNRYEMTIDDAAMKLPQEPPLPTI